MSWLDRLSERRILKSLAEGRLRGLAGEGKPLPDRSGQARLAALTEPADRKAAMAELADLEMRQAIAEESRRRFLRG